VGVGVTLEDVPVKVALGRTILKDRMLSAAVSALPCTGTYSFMRVAIGQISTMGKALQQRCDDRRTGTIERCCKGREEDCSPVSEDSRFAGESFTKEGSPRRDPFPSGSQPFNEV